MVSYFRGAGYEDISMRDYGLLVEEGSRRLVGVRY